jgi:hypothetical protein
MKSIRGMTPASIIELLHDFRFGSRPCENAAPHSETALDHQRGDFQCIFAVLRLESNSLHLRATWGGGRCRH